MVSKTDVNKIKLYKEKIFTIECIEGKTIEETIEYLQENENEVKCPYCGGNWVEVMTDGEGEPERYGMVECCCMNGGEDHSYFWIRINPQEKNEMMNVFEEIGFNSKNKVTCKTSSKIEEDLSKEEVMGFLHTLSKEIAEEEEDEIKIMYKNPSTNILGVLITLRVLEDQKYIMVETIEKVKQPWYLSL